VARYAIGDIQGCMASLERLLALIDFAPGRDELWLVGDLVNRGPRSLDVLRWAVAHDAAVTCVLGNHDLHLLARVAGAAGAKKRDTLDDVLAARDRGRLVDWLRAQPLFHAEGSLAMVHAGLHPRWTVGEARACAAEIEHELGAPTWRAFLAQIHDRGGDGGETRSKGAPRPAPWSDRLGGGDRWRAILAYLVRARMLRPDTRVEPAFDGPPADAPGDLVPWFAFPGAAWTTHAVVFGHWSALGLDLGPHHAAIDTGCVWGRSLTALGLDAERAVFQVKAAEANAA
jgi:bis(5'-nucleosyl)-tetraphosphatase (symmetrical)